MDPGQSTEQKPKISKFAIIAFITPAILWIIGSYLFFVLQVNLLANSWMCGNKYIQFHHWLIEKAFFILLAIVPVSFTLAFCAFKNIKDNKEKLKGHRLVVESVLLSIFLAILTIWFFLKFAKYTSLTRTF